MHHRVLAPDMLTEELYSGVKCSNLLTAGVLDGALPGNAVLLLFPELLAKAALPGIDVLLLFPEHFAKAEICSCQLRLYLSPCLLKCCYLGKNGCQLCL